MLIYFVRHGQTDWNVERRFQGQLDIPINTTGREQAGRNGTVLFGLIKDPECWDFVASPLGRTRETMEIIRTKMGLAPEDYQTDDRLREIHFGDWQGKTWAERNIEDPERTAAHDRQRWEYKTPGEEGESYVMLYERVVSWLETVKNNTVCVSHGGVSRCLQKHFNNISNSEASHLKVPQDKILVISEGKITWA